MRCWSVGVLALALAGSAALPAAAECKLFNQAELNVRFAANQPLVEAAINGKPVWMLVDTGATTSTLFAPAADRLGIAKYQTDKVFIGVGGEVQGYRGRLDTFSLGKASVKDFEMDIGGGANFRRRVGEGDERQVVGILGRDFLALVDVEFDLEHDKVRLFSPKDCAKSSLAYWTKEPDFVEMERVGKLAPFTVPLTINGAPVGAILDSGAQTTVIDPVAASRAGVDESKYDAETGKSVGIGNKVQISHRARFDKIVIGDEQVSNITLQISKLFDREEAETGSRISVRNWQEMLLGADFLHSHRVYIATSQNRIYFTYSGGPVFGRVSSDPGEPAKPGS